MSIEQQLSEAMRAAMTDVRPPADLATAGLARGRRARRRARLLSIGGTVLAVASIAVAGGGVLGEDGGGRATPLGPAATSTTSVDLAGTLRTLLPRGGGLAVDPGEPQDGGLSLSGRYDDGKGAVWISMSLSKFPPFRPNTKVTVPGCLPRQTAPDNACTWTELPDGSFLFIDKEADRPDAPVHGKLWTAMLHRPDGAVIDFAQADSAEAQGVEKQTRPLPPLTTAQMTALVTSPAWNRVVDAIPAPAMPEPGDAPQDEELMAGLRRLLPAGVKIVKAESGDGIAMLVLQDPGGRTSMQVNKHILRDKKGRAEKLEDCAERLRSRPADSTCTHRSLPGGGDLYLEQHPEGPAGSGMILRIADVIRPDGMRMAVSVYNSSTAEDGFSDGTKTRDTPVLTLEQLGDLVTDPGWRP